MKFRDYHFRFRWLPVLLLALPVPLFIGLGVWQMDRAEEKRMQAETLKTRTQLPPLAIDGNRIDVSELRFRKVTVRGRFDASKQFFIENRRHGGKAGFHVITPLRIQNSESLVLVNRGWLPADAKNALPDAPVPAGTLDIAGEAELPSAPALVLHDADSATRWGNRWPYLTLDLYSAQSERPVQPFVILQSPDDTNGFVRQWPREFPKEGMHLGYAVQWFTFALVSLGLYVKLSLERDDEKESAF